ncbi:hypothetical protein ABRZ04_12960 [Castellaniella ginsengisoli]|uniref:Uncharacterized protein n=1 Tax=Castellaniella ginsengisoli TaxID=546114 RepID=A0AB39CYR0_9BURK
MITKEQLSEPPVDLTRLQQLENDFSVCARSIIDTLLKSGRLKISEIDFDFTYNSLAAEAQILEIGKYRIRIGRVFSNAILHFAHWSAPRLMDRLDITKDLTELEDFLYEQWIWLTFHHELSHITCGHLDFLKTHGMVRYAEVYGDDENPDSLKVKGVDKKDAWWIVESEADSQATALSLASFPMTKHCGLLRQQTPFETITMHGMLVSLYFVLFDRLKSSNDIRHPSPAFRKAICQPSLDKLCKQMGLDGQVATEKMIYADFDILSEVLQLQIDMEPYFSAMSWMLEMDALLETMNMRRFRKE